MDKLAGGFMKMEGLTTDIDESKSGDIFVVGAGFGRTGTSSLQLGLNRCGWRSYHMREALKNGAKMMDAIKEVGSLKMQRKEALSDYDPAFTNLDQITLPTEAFDWDERLFN